MEQFYPELQRIGSQFEEVEQFYPESQSQRISSQFEEMEQFFPESQTRRNGSQFEEALQNLNLVSNEFHRFNLDLGDKRPESLEPVLFSFNLNLKGI